MNMFSSPGVEFFHEYACANRFIEQVNSDSGAELPTTLPSKVAAFFIGIQKDPHAHIQASGQNAEALENHVISKIYDKAFCPTQEHVLRDRQLEHVLKLFDVLQWFNFDIAYDITRDPRFSVAVGELRQVNARKTPRGKLTLIVSCCETLMDIVGTSKKQSVTNADTIFPCILLLVCRANPRKLCSNVVFIEEYSHSSYFRAEAEYWFTSIKSAVIFWQNVTRVDYSLHLTLVQANSLLRKCNAAQGGT
jgi:hypothetical protein